MSRPSIRPSIRPSRYRHRCDTDKDFYDIVVYHSPCPDGICAAWVVKMFNSSISLIPFKHNAAPNTSLTGKRVIFVDCCYSPDVMDSLKIKKVLILDHHDSALTSYEGYCYPDTMESFSAYFDMNKSGAQMAWNYFFPEKEMPWFIYCIAARDLKRIEIYPRVDTVGLAACKNHWWFPKLTELYNSQDPERDQEYFHQQGLIFQEDIQRSIGFVFRSAILANMNTPTGERYKISLASCSKDLVTDAAIRMADELDCQFAAIYWFNAKEKWFEISLRHGSKTDQKNPKINLGRIASTFEFGDSEIETHTKGGGHPCAAKFVFPYTIDFYSIFEMI